MTENKTLPAGLFIGAAIFIVFLALGTAVWMERPRLGWSIQTRIIAELCLLSAFLVCLLLIKRFEAVLLQIASLKAVRWLARYDAGKRGSVDQNKSDETVEQLDRAAALRDILRTRHGLRWRYRDRWILLTGDEPLVARLAPGLPTTGYAITGNNVLLYAKQTRDKLDVDWLDQIRRLRRRRPVDAIVAVTRNRTTDKGAPAKPAFDTDDIAHRLARHARALRWAAPVYLLNVTDFGSEPSGPDEPIGFTWSNACVDGDQLEGSLRALVDSLADAGVERLAADKKDRYPAELSRHIAALHSELRQLVMRTAQSGYPRSAVHGLLFAGLYRKRELEPPGAKENESAENTERITRPERTLWRTVSDHSRQLHGHHVGFSLSIAAAWTSVAFIVLWIAGMMTSGVANRNAITSASQTLTTLETATDPTRTAQALDTLDSQLDTLEIRHHDGAPWYTRFGLNRDTALYTALWPAYVDASARILVAPIRARLEERLHQLASLSDAEIASGGADQVKAAYATLKTYLMLARPEHADAAFLTPELLDTASPARPVNSALTEGGWFDLRRRLVTFFAAHLGRRIDGKNPPPAIIADATLVASTRQTVISVIGLQNSTDALYQQILDEARPKYPPLSLASLLGSTVQSGPTAGATTAVGSRGLFGTTSTVPGVFTREAWDERIAKAIDEASAGHGTAGDWVLSDARTTSQDTSALKAELRQRYFDDYARAWEQFLNTLRWQPAASLSGTVDQLTLLSDPQRSPLVALMKAVVWQAGAGAATQSLSDSLISKAKQLTGTDEKNPSKTAANLPDAPLANAFGPILRLAGSDAGNAGDGRSGAAMATGDLSLPRYIERVSAMRLKLQQIVLAPDPNATSRTAAQAVLQGRTSDIAESRDYGSRVAASLGQQWAGFGGLFQAPLDQTWQMVLQPAAASLNETWRSAIVADWDRTFGGRYPFADSDNDASLPEMARFMRPDTGVIAQFMTSQLAGIVERQGDRWVPVQDTMHTALTIDPDFLSTINRLMRVSTTLFPSGDAHVRFDLRGVPAPGVTDMRFVVDGREMSYFNQKEEWVSFVWPDATLESRSHIEWQSEDSGLRSSLDAQGRFGLIRLLEKAHTEQQDNARYLLSWTPDQSIGIALRAQLRSDAGGGPLEVLALRHFALPARVFVVNSRGGAMNASSGPPPLPASAVAAAKRAAVSLPQDTVPGVQ